MMIERERACDDVVLIKGKRASEYARHLMESAGALGPRKNPAWAMVAMAEGTDFKDRVLSILDPNARRSAPRIAFSTIAGLIAALFLVPFVAAQPFAIEPIQITRDLEARSETVTKPSVDEKTEKSEVADKEYSSDEEISATFNKRLFHGIADLVESDNPEEDGKEFGARMINMIADFIPEDNEDDVMAKKFMKGVGDLIKYADNPEMARKKAADLIRALGDLPEHQKREMMDLVEKEIEKASNWPE